MGINPYPECGPGWRDIIRRLMLDLLDLGWDGNVSQIKEKYGELRFYIASGSDAMFDRIDKATEESRHTCEQCGQPGEIKETSSWYRCRCEKCK